MSLSIYHIQELVLLGRYQIIYLIRSKVRSGKTFMAIYDCLFGGLLSRMWVDCC